MKMKLFLAFALVAAAACAADEPRTPASSERRKTPPAKTGSRDRSASATKRSAAAPAQDNKVPAGAVETEPGTWNYTDAQGKKWIYRQTPFGIARIEDKGPAPETKPAKEGEQITVLTDGPVVKFERPSPFGVYRWERKATELNAAEKAAVERFRAGSGSTKQE